LVARRYDVNANQVFGWRKRYRGDVGATARQAASHGKLTIEGRLVTPSAFAVFRALSLEFKGGPMTEPTNLREEIK